MAEDQKKNSKKYIWWIVAFFVLGAIGALMEEDVAEPPILSPEQLVEQQRIEAKRDRDYQGQQAYVACRSFVRQGMASNTKLADVLDFRYKYSFDNDQYYVYSWVEGQNNFGAWIKQQYKCTAAWDATAKDWTFVDMKFLN